VRRIIYEVRPQLLITQSPYMDAAGHNGRHGMATRETDDHTEVRGWELEYISL
jgi:hypothetical protein